MGKAKVDSPLRVGAKVFIRCVTHYQVGRVVGISDHEVILADAAWVADTGRFADALKTGIFKETEPFPGVISVGRAAIVDVCLWNHALPLTQQ